MKTSNYVRARQRLPVKLLQDLTFSVAKDLLGVCQKLNLWNWQGRQVKIVGGSTLLAADTEATLEVYSIHGRQKKGIGFPMIRICALISLGTGSVCDFAMGAHRGKQTGELSLARMLMRSLLQDDVLLGDSLMDSYFFMAQIVQGGADAVFEACTHRKIDFKQGRKSSSGDIEVDLLRPDRPQWMSEEDYKTYPTTLRVRFLKDGDRILVTTLLDSARYPSKKVKELYSKRWNVELDLRCIKDVMGMEMLRSQTPEMLEKEIWAKLLAYNLIRLTMAEAAQKHGCDPRSLSFTGAIQAMNAFIPLIQMAEGTKKQGLQNRLLEVIASYRVGNRPGRREPRVVKRRPKPFPLMNITRQKWKKKRGL